MNYVWDEKKNLSNIRKHGIDFADVPALFEQPTVQSIDRREDYGEERWIAIGQLKHYSVAVVIYVEKTEDTIRIISARKANQSEKKYYEKNIGNRL